MTHIADPAGPPSVATVARDAKARENRERHPEVAAFVDEVRRHFPGAVVTYIGPVRRRAGDTTQAGPHLRDPPNQTRS